MTTCGELTTTPPACRPGPADRHEDRRRDARRPSLRAALEAPVLRLRDDPILLLEILVLVNLFSTLDLAITVLALDLGAVELNPFMAYLFGLGVAPAAAGKVGIVLAATLGLWLLRRHQIALKTAALTFVVYASLITFELIGLIRLA